MEEGGAIEEIVQTLSFSEVFGRIIIIIGEQSEGVIFLWYVHVTVHTIMLYLLPYAEIFTLVRSLAMLFLAIYYVYIKGQREGM